MGNQPLPSHSIKPGLFLPLELQIMSFELVFRPHDGYRSKKDIFFMRLLYIQYGPYAIMDVGGNCLYPNLIWLDPIIQA